MGPERLGFLMDRHAAALELFARQWCVTPEDVVQDAFVKLSWQRTEPSQVVAWLYRVVRNTAISAARSERRRAFHESLAAAQVPWFVEDASGQLDATAVTAALERLPLEQREIIVAHLWGGLTYEQIAELTGTSAATVCRRYQAGLNDLRTRLNLPCPKN